MGTPKTLEEIRERQRIVAELREAQRQAARQSEERQLEAALGNQIINIGYKAIAKECRSVIGGDKDKMRQLTKERNRLRAALSNWG
jgi:hypothetical protein